MSLQRKLSSKEGLAGLAVGIAVIAFLAWHQYGPKSDIDQCADAISAFSNADRAALISNTCDKLTRADHLRAIAIAEKHIDQ